MKQKLSFLLATTSMALCAGAKDKPNVLFILVDDMQATSIGALGNKDVVSPNIDKLINSGTSFVNTYTNGAMQGALSMPSRAMIMTGKRLFELNKDGQSIPQNHVTMPQVFRDNGYATFATGKWHNDRASFNRSFADGENIFFGGMHSYESQGHEKPVLHHYDVSGKYNERFVGDKFSSQMYADAAIDFINEKTESKDPFFAYVAFTSPHDPRMKHPDYAKYVDKNSISLPANFKPEHPFDNGEMDVRDEKLIATPRGEDISKADLANYYMMINEVDTQIGRIIATLEASSEADNTIIVFASDNGLAVGRHGLIGKQNLYEHSAKVPLAIVAPGVKPKISTALCYLSDVAPTVCELAGLDVAPSMSGISLEPVISNNNKKGERESLLLVYAGVQRALVYDNYKLIVYNVDGVVTKQLFNIKKDPLEKNNLSDDSKYKDKVSSMTTMLKKRMVEDGDFGLADTFKWKGKPLYTSWSDALKN